MQFLLVLSITRLVSAPIVVFVAFMQSVCDLQVLLYKFFWLHGTSGPLRFSLDVPRYTNILLRAARYDARWFVSAPMSCYRAQEK